MLTPTPALLKLMPFQTPVSLAHVTYFSATISPGFRVPEFYNKQSPSMPELLGSDSSMPKSRAVR